MATRWFVALSVILALADQATKWVARHGLMPGVHYNIIPDFFRITLNFNKGIAWGMLPGWSQYFTYFAIIMVLVILMIMRKLDRDEIWLKIALAFQMAGAIGNMADRLIRKEVTDFLDVTLFPHTHFDYALNLGFRHIGIHFPYDWPIFNLADSFVVTGTTVLVLVLLFAREAPRAPKANAPVRVGEGLGASEGALGWEDRARVPGSVSADEALIELPSTDECEMLIPLEEVEKVRGDRIGEPMGVKGEEEQVPPDDGGKLDELSRRPER
jgi:signal peptidase II